MSKITPLPVISGKMPDSFDLDLLGNLPDRLPGRGDWIKRIQRLIDNDIDISFRGDGRRKPGPLNQRNDDRHYDATFDIRVINFGTELEPKYVINFIIRVIEFNSHQFQYKESFVDFYFNYLEKYCVCQEFSRKFLFVANDHNSQMAELGRLYPKGAASLPINIYR
jgi:hypothetical protein